MARQISFDAELKMPELTDMVTTILIHMVPGTKNVVIDRVDLLAAISEFRAKTPYGLAKQLGLLKDNSAEDMSIEFMTFANKIFPNSF